MRNVRARTCACAILPRNRLVQKRRAVQVRNLNELTLTVTPDDIQYSKSDVGGWTIYKGYNTVWSELCECIIIIIIIINNEFHRDASLAKLQGRFRTVYEQSLQTVL